MLLWMLLEPAARDVYPEWEHEAGAMVARFRMATARRPPDPETLALVERLRTEAPEFARWWKRHDVLTQGSGRKHLSHPIIGQVSFEHIVLRVAEEPEQTLVTFSPPAGERPPLEALAAACP
jgi:hypothetical protein